MIRGKKCIVLSVLIFIFTSMTFVCPGEAQYSPLSNVVGFGGLFNPLVFFPGLRSAASYYPVFDPFAALSYTPSPLFNPIYYPVAPTLPFAPFPVIPTALSATPAVTVPTRTAAQTGTWSGTWTSTYFNFIIVWQTGPMFMNIVVDPLGGVLGSGILQGSKYATLPFDLSGVEVNNIITLSGLLATGYGITLTCILTSPTTMTGYWVVTGTHVPVIDEGLFDLTLISPAII